MFLEDATSRSLSSVDFGRAAQDAARNPKGLALPPPTEFIHAPSEILDEEAALQQARLEKQSILWRARVRLRRVSEIARDLALQTWELLSHRIESDTFDYDEPEVLDEQPDLPPLEVSQEIDLREDDDADTARVPTPVPFPAHREGGAPGKDEWTVTTQVVDMTRRRKGKGTRPGSLPGRPIPVSDPILDPSRRPKR